MPNENFIWPLFLSRGNGRPYFLHSVHISKPRKISFPTESLSRRGGCSFIRFFVITSFWICFRDPRSIYPAG